MDLYELSAARTNVNEPLIQKVSIYQKIGTSLKKNQNGNISPKMSWYLRQFQQLIFQWLEFQTVEIISTD